MVGEVAVIGGGRWARQIAGVLRDVCAPGTSAILCSPSNPDGWTEWSSAQPPNGVRFKIVRDLDALLRDDAVTHVFVVRAARDNAETAIAALRAGKCVFIEKPFALNIKQANAVVAAAEGRTCVVGLVFLHARNLERFARAATQIGKLQSIVIGWADAAVEARYNEVKRFDIGLNVVVDVLPHIWSIIRLILPEPEIRLEAVDVDSGGRSVALRFSVGEADIRVALEREATARTRSIEIVASHGRAAIDFASEPGLASVSGRSLDVAAGFSSPLRREVESFLRMTSADCAGALSGVAKAIEVCRLAEAAMLRVRDAQRAAIGKGFAEGADPSAQLSAAYALREVVASRWPAFARTEHRALAIDSIVARIRSGERPHGLDPAKADDLAALRAWIWT